MSRNAPHPRSAVEGYYNKFDLDNGAHVVVIICTVRVAQDPDRQHMLSFTYYPSQGYNFWQRQYFSKPIRMTRLGLEKGFELQVPSVGAARFLPNGDSVFDLDFNDFNFKAEVKNRTQWSEARRQAGETSPEGWLSYLPLPLHWHVSTLRSHGNYELQVLSDAIPRSMSGSGGALVHQEKNWGNAFPESHVWIQARQGERGICLAGGAVLPGVKAFLVGYRSEDINFDFKPPFALELFGISPFMSSQVHWGERNLELDVSSMTKRLIITAKAPQNSFFTLGAPFAEGHREDALAESFRATATVIVYQRSSLFMPWKELRREIFERASLEFGGAYFGGLDKKRK